MVSSAVGISVYRTDSHFSLELPASGFVFAFNHRHNALARQREYMTDE